MGILRKIAMSTKSGEARDCESDHESDSDTINHPLPNYEILLH